MVGLNNSSVIPVSDSCESIAMIILAYATVSPVPSSNRHKRSFTSDLSESTAKEIDSTKGCSEWNWNDSLLCAVISST